MAVDRRRALLSRTSYASDRYAIQHRYIFCIIVQQLIFKSSFQQTFGQATSVDSSFQNSGFSGLLGLGWPSLSAENAVPFVQNILPQLSSQLFTVWLNRYICQFFKIYHEKYATFSSVGAQSQTQETTYGGMITFGGLDTTHCSSTVNYVPLTSLSYWQFAMAR